MAFTRELLLSTERSILRSLLVVSAVLIFCSRELDPIMFETAAAVRATRATPTAASTRAQAITSLKRLQNVVETPRRTRASSPPPSTTSKERRGSSRGRSYAFP
jgi:hypothetical protein